ncbi:MAG: hypothetical protein IKR11_08135 [Solobacterium sp.]|nr:hypothetical protein [Solobacterium sp.]
MKKKYNCPSCEKEIDAFPFHSSDLKNLFLAGRFVVRNAKQDEDYEAGKSLLKMGMNLGDIDSARELLQAYERDAYSDEDLIEERMQCVRMLLQNTEDGEEIYRLIRQYYPHMSAEEALDDLDRIVNGTGIHDSLKTMAMILCVKIDQTHYSKRLLIQKAYENRFIHECLVYLQDNLRLSRLEDLNEETALYFYEKTEKEGKGKEFIEAIKKSDVYYKDELLDEIEQYKKKKIMKKESMKKRYEEDLHQLHDLLDKKG